MVFDLDSGGGKLNLAYFHGRKYAEEKEEYFQNADIFVFPTFYPNECFPLVLLEAMQQSLPCISTNEGGIASIIDDGKTGFLVEKLNPVQLVGKIEVMLKDRELREDMGRAGKKKFEQEFTLSKFEERMLKILQMM